MLLTFVTYIHNKRDKNQKPSQGLFPRQRMYPTKEDCSRGFGRGDDPENSEKGTANTTLDIWFIIFY